MNRDRYYELAYAFRDTKIWKQLYEEELFAVKLPSEDGGRIGYCSVMGRNGEHMSLAVYVGAEGFTSLRKLLALTEQETVGPADYLTQDCIQCSLEQRDQFPPQELDAVRAFCRKTDRPFRAPLPKFTRFYPCCVPWEVTDEADWKAIETALLVLVKLSETIRRDGKAALGLHPVAVGLEGDSYVPEQLGLFGNVPTDGEVTVPLYSLVNGELRTERIPLPPYTEKSLAAPAEPDDAVMAKLKRKPKKGVYECEIIRLPEPQEGEPPYLPAVLITVTGEGFLREPSIGQGAVYDPDQLLNDFIDGLGDSCPKAIKVRTEETKNLLEPFCKKANILLAHSDRLEHLDEAVDYMMSDLWGDEEEDEGDTEDDVNDIIQMISEMSVAQMREMPGFILDQILDAAEFFPPEIISKVRKARGRKR